MADITHDINGKRQLKLVDLTEAVIEVDIDSNDSKLITFDELYKREVPQLSKAGHRPRDFRASAILSAIYPLGTEGFSDQKLREEIKKIQDKKVQHKAKTWFFYLSNLSQAAIRDIKYRQCDGSYK